MTDVQQIIREHQEKAGSITNGYQAELDHIRDDNSLPPEQDSPYLEDAARYGAVIDHKRERASVAHRRALEDYQAEVERYHKALGSREAELKERLFGLGDSDAAVLAQAALADDNGLEGMRQLAERTSNASLARAIFVEADRRGLGEMLSRHFESHPEERGLYQEWSEIPAQGQRERQLEGVERIVSEPTSDRLMSRPQVNAY